jgi:hypothetical protein
MQTPTVRETRRAGQRPRTTRALVVQSLLLGIRTANQTQSTSNSSM